MPRRKPLGPDLRPDWRDPNMPVLVSTKSEGLTEWDPARLQRVASAKLNLANEPLWHSDPTYHLRKDKP